MPAAAHPRVQRIAALVVADIVFKSSAGCPSEEELSRFCLANLAEHMVPRLWNVMASIPVTDGLKARLPE